MSNPFARIFMLGPISKMHRHGQKEEAVKVYLRLCFDDLFEVLRFGKRLSLCKLERVGRRFHCIIEKCFPDVPFFRLDLDLKPIEGGGLEAFIRAAEADKAAKDDKKAIALSELSDKKAIALSELVDVPLFLRFGFVHLEYFRLTGSQSIAEKCESFNVYLPTIKAVLYDAKMISFNCHINQEDPGHFSNHSALIEHIRHIVSICDSFRGYSFNFGLQTDSDAAENMIDLILKMPEVSRSSMASIIQFSDPLPVIQLPIETIANWLNRERHVLDHKKQERNLLLLCTAQNAHFQELCDFLKQKFTTAKLSTIPFNLQLGSLAFDHIPMDVNSPKVINETTNEQFSVSNSKLKDLFGLNVAEVKRTRAPKKDEKNLQNSKG